MKVFRTTSVDVITECRHWFGLPEIERIAKRKERFSAKSAQCDNVLCQLFTHVECVTYGNLDTIYLFVFYLSIVFVPVFVCCHLKGD